MENSDDVKEDVRARLKKFGEIVEALPKYQEAFSEIKVSLETSFPESILLPQQQNKVEDIAGRIDRLIFIRKYLVEKNGCGDEELGKIMKEENIDDADFLKDYNDALANVSKTNLWKRFWHGNVNQNNQKTELIMEVSRLLEKVKVSIEKLKNKQEEIKKAINANYASLRKNIAGKEPVIVEMYLKKEHLRKFISSSEEFLLSLKEETSESVLSSSESDLIELKKRLESVSFGEATLEEKKRSRSDKEKEIANSATEFKKLDEEKKRLDEEIFSILDFITKTKTEISENEKKISVSLEVKKKIDAEVLEKTCEEIEKIKIELEENLGSYYFLGRSDVFCMCSDFVNRTFVTDAFLLEKWLATGKKAVVVRNEEAKIMWKEWRDEEEEVIRWFFTEKYKEGREVRLAFTVNALGLEINISE